MFKSVRSASSGGNNLLDRCAGPASRGTRLSQLGNGVPMRPSDTSQMRSASVTLRSGR